jgi:hypothetical protein
VREFPSSNREFWSRAVSTIAVRTPDAIREEMRTKIRALAAMCPGAHSIKAGLDWAARKARIAPGEAKRLAYSEMTIVPAHIADQVRDAARDAEVEADIQAASRLLARIQKDDFDAALPRNLVEGLSAMAGATAHSGP